MAGAMIFLVITIFSFIFFILIFIKIIESFFINNTILKEAIKENGDLEELRKNIIEMNGEKQARIIKTINRNSKASTLKTPLKFKMEDRNSDFLAEQLRSERRYDNDLENDAEKLKEEHLREHENL